MFVQHFKKCISLLCLTTLSACSLFLYQPLQTIDRVDLSGGYRMIDHTENPRSSSELFVILLISGGGSRAASFGYGVLESLKEQNLYFDGRNRRLEKRVFK